MGVCGAGKTSVGRTLATRLGARYIEADDFHPPDNRRAMEQGIPLTDEMRQPWLMALSVAAEQARQEGTVVMACSALKRRYRELLRANIGSVRFIFLHADRDVIAQRMSQRTGHFMPVTLLDSQIATLEPPAPDEDALAVNVARPKAEIDDIVERHARAEATRTAPC
jgi:gluconokinase